MNSLNGSNDTLNVELEIQEAFSSAPSTVKHDSKTPPKKILQVILRSPRKRNTIN